MLARIVPWIQLLDNWFIHLTTEGIGAKARNDLETDELTSPSTPEVSSATPSVAEATPSVAKSSTPSIAKSSTVSTATATTWNQSRLDISIMTNLGISGRLTSRADWGGGGGKQENRQWKGRASELKLFLQANRQTGNPAVKREGLKTQLFLQANRQWKGRACRNNWVLRPSLFTAGLPVCLFAGLPAAIISSEALPFHCLFAATSSSSICLKSTGWLWYGFAGHGSFGPQKLPKCPLRETEEKYDLHVKPVLQKKNFRPIMAIFIEKRRWFYPPRTPKVCRAWLIWALNPTYKSPLRNWTKIWPPWEICASKNEFSTKTGSFHWKNEVVLPPRTPKVYRAWLIWAPNPTYKSPLSNRTKIWLPCEICASKNEFLSKKGNFYWKNEVVLPPQDPQGLQGMAPLGPKSFLQVSSEKLKTNMTSIWNLCLRKWVFVQKWHFLLKKWGSFTPPGPPRFAGHGSFGPQILPTCLLWETGKKYDLHVKSVPQKMSLSKNGILYWNKRWL